MPSLLWALPAKAAQADDAQACELAQLREENALLRIRLGAAENRATQWQQIHESARETWVATYNRDLAIYRAALIDVHAAIVHDRLSPEDQPCAGMVIQ
jgi:hypothetical protein